MKSSFLGIPLFVAGVILLSGCTGGQDSDNPAPLPSVAPSNGIIDLPKANTPTADPTKTADTNQGRNTDPIPKSDFTPPAGSAYDASEKGKGVDESKDAGDSASADEINAPINNGGMGTQAGVAVVYTGKGFPASTPVNVTILTVDGTDTGVKIDSATTDGEGNLSARVYFPKNLSSGSYEVVFNTGGTEQKTKIDLIAGLN